MRRRTQRPSAPSAFTLIELLVVIAIIAILAALLFPALAKAKSEARKSQCAGNHQNLALAWSLYHSDNDGKVAVNQPEAGATPWVSGTVHGSSPGFTNPDYLVTRGKASFAPYLMMAQIYKCPAEHIVFKSPEGASVPKLRSYSMNINFAPSRQTADGLLYFYTTDQVLAPSSTFVFIDVEPVSICYAPFFVPASDTNDWWHAPGSLHNKGANISFADDHIEYHHWKMPYDRPMSIQTPTDHPTARGDPTDIAWVRRRAYR